MDVLDVSFTTEVYSVSRLAREARLTLEGSFPVMWVEGEVSDFKIPSSGHWYFCLKDSFAQVRCAMFRSQNRQLNFVPKEGMHVLLKGRVTLYEGRSEFQIIVDFLEEAGIGKLHQQFEILKNRLREAGLFSDLHKKKLPIFPNKIGIITSPTGAAIRDILSVLKRRFPSAPIIIYPTQVQGETASYGIVHAIETANSRQECDVLILARGGGSIEDLWCFNEERVALAIHKSQLPIISGVGHEIDFTIADFVADVRAPTPSAAAELIVPHTDELLATLHQREMQFLRFIHLKIANFLNQLKWLEKNLYQQHPQRKLTDQSQKLDHAETSLLRAQTKLLHHLKGKLSTLHAQLLGATPKHTIQNHHQALILFSKTLQTALWHTFQSKQHTFQCLIAKMDALNPLAVLKRGFAIVTDQNQKVITKSCDTKVGNKLKISLTKGYLNCTVDEIDSQKPCKIETA